MKRMLKKVILVVTFLLITFLLCSCGAKISTLLTVNNDFSGERVITCVAAKSDVSGNFKGGVNKIDDIFAKYCPPDMKYSKTEDAYNYVYTLRLPFTSLDDYKQKVKKITGRDANIIFSVPNSVFASGVAVSEDFNSIDLLSWFKKIVQDEKLMDDVSNLWEISGTKVTFNGKEYSTGSNINVNDITYNPLEKIVINTTKNSDGSFSRTINYVIPSSTYNANTEKIKTFMNSVVPQGATGSWTSSVNGQTFTISFSAKDASELVAKMSTVLNSKSCTVTENPGNGINPFSKYTDFSENLDLSAFASDSQSRVNVEYKFTTVQSEKIIGVQAGDNNIGNPNSNTYSGSFRTGVLKLRLMAEKKYTVNSIDIKTSVHSGSLVDKNIVFTYAVDASNEASVVAKRYFESLKIPKLAIDSTTNKNGQQICEITASGNTQEVNSALMVLFGKGNSVDYTTRKKSIFTIEGNFTETINMSDFMSRIGYSQTINYTVKANDGERIKELSISPSNYNSSASGLNRKIGNSYNTAISAYARINYTGNKITVIGVLLMILIWLTILLAIVSGFIFLIKWLAKKDGLQDEDLKTLIIHYLKVARSKIIEFAIDLKDFILNFREMFISDSDRIPIIKYFHGSKWPILLVILTILQIPSTIGGLIGGLVGKLSHNIFTATAWGVGLRVFFPIMTLIVALAWYLVERFIANPKQEAVVDAFVESDLKNFKERALLKLGLIDEQVSIIAPIKVTGPYYGFSQPDINRSIPSKILNFAIGLITYRTKLIFKYGSDGKVRYSLIHAQIFLFNETQIYAYEAGYDLCTGQVFEETTTEYFYKDVDCVITGEKMEDIVSGKNIIKKRFEFFKVVVSSGEYNHAVVDTDRSILSNQIMAMRNLIREKKT